MSETGSPDDATLLAQLDTSAARHESWGRLLAVSGEFALRPHAEGDFRLQQQPERADGVRTLSYPVYGERVNRACDALREVGAVTPVYHWIQHRPPAVPNDGSLLAPADAVRLATAILRGERFGDGVIGNAAQEGTLQAVLASLSSWYRNRRDA